MGKRRFASRHVTPLVAYRFKLMAPSARHQGRPGLYDSEWQTAAAVRVTESNLKLRLRLPGQPPSPAARCSCRPGVRLSHV